MHIFFSGLTKLLVATGTIVSQTVEIVNLDKTRPNLICDNLPSLPTGLRAATGQLFQRITPIICGGYSTTNWTTQLASGFKNECNVLFNGRWTSTVSMKTRKAYMSSSLLTSPSGDVLFVSGGWDLTNYDTVESFDGTSWSSDRFVHLPTAVNGHCTVTISNSLLMSIGGNLNTNIGGNGGVFDVTGNTYFFNVNENNWVVGPSLKSARAYHSCGVMNWKNPNTGSQEKVVVVAGIYSYNFQIKNYW